MTKDSQDPAEKPIEIPWKKVSPEALAGILENFILREGTDYGTSELTYEQKAERVRKQLEKGDIKIVFDQSSETVSLMTRRDFEKWQASFDGRSD